MSILDDVGGAFSDLGDLAAAGTLTRKTPGTYDPATGTSSVTTTTSACKAVLDATSIRSLGFKFGEGLVQAGDLMATIPSKGLAFNPAAGDTLTLTVGTFTLVSVSPTYAGSVPVMFACLVRV